MAFSLAPDVQTSSQDHGGNRREVLERYGLARVVDFSASINPLGCPPGLLERIAAVWGEILHYPDRDCRDFRRAVAERFSLDPAVVLAGNGSAELLDLLLRGTAHSRLVLCSPDFGLYERLAPDAGRVVYTPRLAGEGFLPDLRALVHAVRPGDLILLSNPGNPGGRAAEPPDFAELLERCRDLDATLAVDEAFADFCPKASLLSECATQPNLVILRSLTKFYGIPGLRLGFLVASPDRLRPVAALQVPWSVNAVAQAAGVYCLSRRHWEEETLACVDRGRRQLWSGLARIAGLTPLPAQANYFLVEIFPPSPPAAVLFDGLSRRGILVRHCGSFGLGERYLRVAVRSNEENDLLLGALADVAGTRRPAAARPELRPGVEEATHGATPAGQALGSPGITGEAWISPRPT